VNRSELIQQRTRPDLLFYWSPAGPRRQRFGKWIFSQRFPARFTVDGQQYAHVHQFVAAEKARLFGDREVRDLVLATPDPVAIRRLEWRIRHFDHLAWAQYLYEVAERGNIAKFSTYPWLRDYLGTTIGHVLVEASPRDRLGGIGLAEARPEAGIPARWRGENVHGFALMAAREAMR
jgi:ribA/ribD-fused uncharacterized protein